MQGVPPPQPHAPAIVSASYRTDIPAFCTPWLLRRLAAGFCRVANPYGGAADIGASGSCAQGCAYCYAVASPERARRRLRAHDPEEAMLMAPAQAPA